MKYICVFLSLFILTVEARSTRRSEAEDWGLETGQKEAWKAVDEYGSQELSANRKGNGLESDDFVENGMPSTQPPHISQFPEREPYQAQKAAIPPPGYTSQSPEGESYQAQKAAIPPPGYTSQFPERESYQAQKAAIPPPGYTSQFPERESYQAQKAAIPPPGHTSQFPAERESYQAQKAAIPPPGYTSQFPEGESYQVQKSMQDVDSNTARVKVQAGNCACNKKVKKGLLQALQSCINVLNAMESCTGRSKRAVDENVQLMSSCACSQKANSDLIQSLKSCTDAIMTTSSCITTFSSCAEIKSYNPGSASGEYQLHINNKTVTVYCHMGALCGIDGGWTRLGKLDMTQPSSTCPSSLQLITQSGTRICTKNKAGCQSIPIPSQGLKYSQVCGRVRGYHKYTLDGFLNRGIDGVYVDGVSITRGSPRKHIWSLGGSTVNHRGCPCSGGRRAASFVGIDYYCESGFPSSPQNSFGVADPLWDGKNCPSNEANCCSPSLLPWFLKRIGSTTTDNIEMRVCSDEAPSNENIGIDQYEIYIN